MFRQPHVVGHGAHTREVRGVVEQQAILESQAVPAKHLVRDGQQARIADFRME